MADETVTSETEPRETPVTSETEPQTSPPEPSPETSSPDDKDRQIADLQSRLQRLEANNKGTFAEWQREKQLREQYERLNLERQRQPVEQPKPQAVEGPSYEEIAEQEAAALLAGDKRELARLKKVQVDRAKELAKAEFRQELITVSQTATRNQAVDSYIRGVVGTDPNGPFFQRIRTRMSEMANDPGYAFCHDNPQWMASLAAKELEAEAKASKKQAREEDRVASIRQANTESGAKGTTVPPGQTPKADDKAVYLTPTEKHIAAKLIGYSGITTQADAERKYWAGLREDVREKRQKERRAV